jgi:hypothetical protein
MVPSSPPPTVNFFRPALTDADGEEGAFALLLLLPLVGVLPSMLLLRTRGLASLTPFGLLITSETDGRRREARKECVLTSREAQYTRGGGKKLSVGGGEERGVCLQFANKRGEATAAGQSKGTVGHTSRVRQRQIRASFPSSVPSVSCVLVLCRASLPFAVQQGTNGTQGNGARNGRTDRTRENRDRKKHNFDSNKAQHVQYQR